MSDENENEFAALAREAERLDGSHDAGAAPGGAATVDQSAPEQEAASGGTAPADDLAEARAVIALLCSVGTALFPFLAPIYTAPTQERLATVAAPLMRKHGLTAGGLFARYREEIEFAMVALPLAGATYQAFRAHRAPVTVQGEAAPAPERPAAEPAAA